MTAAAIDPIDANGNPTYLGKTHRCTDVHCHVADFVMSLPEQAPTACATCENTALMVTSIRTDMNQVMTLLGLIHDEIKPTLEALSNSPIMKMLGVKINE